MFHEFYSAPSNAELRTLAIGCAAAFSNWNGREFPSAAQISGAQSFCDRARPAIADFYAIDFDDGGRRIGGRGDEGFARRLRILDREWQLFDFHLPFSRDPYDRSTRHAMKQSM